MNKVTTGGHSKEVDSGQRFEFGKNWRKFLSLLDDDRLAEAERSLKEMLMLDDLEGMSFLDIGSGSGLFSLSARRLGARVHSFDYDPQSAACTRELKRRYFPNDKDWIVEEGSVLDRSFLHTLGTFDIVYSWGVLHHTGAMWTALDNIQMLVKDDGLLYIALYNDCGLESKFWLLIKQAYCSGKPGKMATTGIFIPYYFARTCGADLLTLKNPLKRFKDYKKSRGMSLYYDWIDWLGGYPYEVAGYEEITEFFAKRGFRTVNSKRTEGLGNNEFVFLKGT